MTFDLYEKSEHLAVPSVLYEFRLGTAVWTYTSSEHAITLFGGTEDELVFEPAAISDGGYSQSGDVSNDDMTITLPKSLPLVDLFKGTPPSEAVYVVVRRKNRGNDEAAVVWVGSITNLKVVDAVSAEAVCWMLTSSFNRNGLRLAWSRGCPHALYDIGCRADKAAFAISMQVTALTPVSVTSPALIPLADNYLSGGFFEWELTEGVLERRPIETQAAGVMVVLGITDGLNVGDWITVYPGCDRTSSTCESKFNNLLNYGGFPHMPGKSPFDGDPVF